MRVDVTGVPQNLQITVPDSAKSGILILCGANWNTRKLFFSDPTGAGIVSAQKLHDAYGGAMANLHIVAYVVSLKSGGSITATVSPERTDTAMDPGSGTSMILLY